MRVSWLAGARIVSLTAIAIQSSFCKLAPDGGSGGVYADDYDDPPCRLFLERQRHADTADGDGSESYRWVFYAGVDYAVGEVIGDGEDLVLLIDNANKNEFSPWHTVVWDSAAILPESLRRPHPRGDGGSGNDSGSAHHRLYQQDVFMAGLGCLTTCADGETYHANIHVDASRAHRRTTTTTTSLQQYLDESDAAAAAADADIRNVVFVAQTKIQAGERLVVDCFDPLDNGGNRRNPAPSAVEVEVKQLETLRQDAICVDAIAVRESTVEGVGRGAFARRFVAKHEVLSTSPVVPVDRSQTEIVQQEYYGDQPLLPLRREHNIQYTSHVIGRQLMLNYLYGNAHSNVQLLPLGPGVNFINHDSDRPNVYIRWSPDSDSTSLRETVPVMELLEQDAPSVLALDFVALEDILPGDELFLDYGHAYATAWASRIDHSYDSYDDPPSFRHEIGVPNNLYPSNWMRSDPNPNGDFIASALGPGQMAPVRWAGSAEVVSPWAFRLGLHSRVASVLLDYCQRMGIVNVLRHVTSDGNGLEPGTDTPVGRDWYLQRPDNNWRSNLHWYSPLGARAHEDYLQTLSVAGFDEILQGIGDYLGMDGLVAFHVTFIGVSFSNRGFLHHDVTNSSAKVFNVIIPLILANETGPELDLKERKPDLPAMFQEDKVGRYRYEYNVASMVGDDAIHATSACDYRNTKEMRLAATIYIADVNDDNVHNILDHYTQAYPPKDIELLKSWMARHWKRGDPSVRLPKPNPDHILLRNNNNTGNQLLNATISEVPTSAPTDPDEEL